MFTFSDRWWITELLASIIISVVENKSITSCLHKIAYWITICCISTNHNRVVLRKIYTKSSLQYCFFIIKISFNLAEVLSITSNKIFQLSLAMHIFAVPRRSLQYKFYFNLITFRLKAKKWNKAFLYLVSFSSIFLFLHALLNLNQFNI